MLAVMELCGAGASTTEDNVGIMVEVDEIKCTTLIVSCLVAFISCVMIDVAVVVGIGYTVCEPSSLS